MLHSCSRLAIIFELTSYAIAIFVIISYATHNWTQNQAFYNIEVDYTKWVTNLPAYTICPTIKNSFISKQLNRLTSSNNSEVIQFVKGVLRPGKRYCRKCESEQVKSNFKNNFRLLTQIMSEPCENIFAVCSWNGEPFQCCTKFHKILTDNGICFTLNSVYSQQELSEMTTSIYRPKARLVLELTATVRIYVQDGKTLQFPRDTPKIKKGEKADIIYKFTEWTEDPSSWFLNRAKRNCTLMRETRVYGFDVYSESACKLRCKAIQQQRMCECKHHLLPGFEKDCDLQGLICLDGINEKYNCDCLEECSRLHVTYVKFSIEKSLRKSSRIVVSLSGPPTERIVLTSRITPITSIVVVACLSRLVTEKSVPELIQKVYFMTRTLASWDTKPALRR